MAGFYLEPLLSKTNFLTAEPQGIAGQMESLSEYITRISLAGSNPYTIMYLKGTICGLKKALMDFTVRSIVFVQIT